MTEPKILEEITPANEFHRNKFSARQGITKLYWGEDLKKEAKNWIKKQHPKDENEIQLFFHCKKCLSSNMEVGYTHSQSLIIIKCKTCGNVVKKINLADIQNAWIKHFFGIENTSANDSYTKEVRQ